ncbi:hypothetical protein HanXRQr2_Chr15g0675781 [Helianthus annuus]|uniref:Uncharacterized protein n=1 Tax=Helianthus annuus TaxID=4232 RepID=A0A9K3H1H5_HELAN|nr:hypothetical protein HanXRQr2_Chr15g0675781 [Helianthus annuus]
MLNFVSRWVFVSCIFCWSFPTIMTSSTFSKLVSNHIMTFSTDTPSFLPLCRNRVEFSYRPLCLSLRARTHYSHLVGE